MIRILVVYFHRPIYNRVSYQRQLIIGGQGEEDHHQLDENRGLLIRRTAVTLPAFIKYLEV